jgi:uncharacterized glyoxalase superfamily metalloenzyme YdcJ
MRVTTIEQGQLRAAFARRLPAVHGQVVPLYTTLVGAFREVDSGLLAHSGADAESLGCIARVTTWRHGAIRVGTPAKPSIHDPFAFYECRQNDSMAAPAKKLGLAGALG